MNSKMVLALLISAGVLGSCVAAAQFAPTTSPDEGTTWEPTYKECDLLDEQELAAVVEREQPGLWGFFAEPSKHGWSVECWYEDVGKGPLGTYDAWVRITTDQPLDVLDEAPTPPPLSLNGRERSLRNARQIGGLGDQAWYGESNYAADWDPAPAEEVWIRRGSTVLTLGRFTRARDQAESAQRLTTVARAAVERMPDQLEIPAVRLDPPCDRIDRDLVTGALATNLVSARSIMRGASGFDCEFRGRRHLSLTVTADDNPLVEMEAHEGWGYSPCPGFGSPARNVARRAGSDPHPSGRPRSGRSQMAHRHQQPQGWRKLRLYPGRAKVLPTSRQHSR
jgi:hypothetical protein